MPRYFLWLLIALVISTGLEAQESTLSPSSTSSSSAVAVQPDSSLNPHIPYSPPTPVAKPVRDPQALQIAQRAIAAMGGAALANIRDLTITADIAAVPDGPIRAKIPQDTPSSSSKIVWTLAGAEFHIDSLVGGKVLTTVSGHGQPQSNGSGATKGIKPYVLRAYFAPPAVALVLFREIQDPTYSIELKTNAQLNGSPVEAITTSSKSHFPDNVFTQQTWYFNNATGLPLHVDFRYPDTHNPANFLEGNLDLSEYRAVSGVIYPFQVISSVAGRPDTIFKITSVTPNTGVSPTVFDSVVPVNQPNAVGGGM